MTVPVVENEPTTNPVEGQQEGSQETLPVEVDDSKDESKLSDYWRGELSRARSEAGNYRTQLREAQKALGEAKSPEEFAAATAELSDKIAKLETANMRSEAARKHNLPDALAARLQGATAEEIEADAKALAELIPAATPKQTPPARPPRGGLNPAGDLDPDETDPAKLAMAVERHTRRLI